MFLLFCVSKIKEKLTFLKRKWINNWSVNILLWLIICKKFNACKKDSKTVLYAQKIFIKFLKMDFDDWLISFLRESWEWWFNLTAISAFSLHFSGVSYTAALPSDCNKLYKRKYTIFITLNVKLTNCKKVYKFLYISQE